MELRKLFTALLLPWVVVTTVWAGSDDAERLKAAYLYHICKFVQWPERAMSGGDKQLRIAVYGVGERQMEYFNALVGKRVNERTLDVGAVETPEQAAGAHLLFIGEADDELLHAMIAESRQSALLTVGDHDTFAAAGGMVTLVTVKNRLRMVVNLKAAEASGLVFSSKLLEVATIYDDERGR